MPSLIIQANKEWNDFAGYPGESINLAAKLATILFHACLGIHTAV